MRERIANVIDHAVQHSQSGSVPSNVQPVLNADNDYIADLFLDQIAQVMQSKKDSIGDKEIEFIVTVAQNRSGGVHLKLSSLQRHIFKKEVFL